MKKSFVAAALAAGLVGPASAATVIDFTANDATFVGGTDGYTVTGGSGLNTPGVLSNPRHETDLGCTGSGWDFVCAVNDDGKYDVGFGVKGNNPNEVDGALRTNEWVQVTFNTARKVLGFAGMLTYRDSQGGVCEEDYGDCAPIGKETVVLQYLLDGIWVTAGTAEAINDDNDPGDSGDDKFTTVGLAWLRGLNIMTTAVRFTASGIDPFDDGNANITAAGLELAPVPVPASFPLLLAGIGALGFAARRKRKAA